MSAHKVTITPNVQSLAYAATLTLDYSQSTFFVIGPLTGALALAVKNVPAGQAVFAQVQQDATGARAVTYGGAGGMTITGNVTVSAVASAYTTIMFIGTGATTAAGQVMGLV